MRIAAILILFAANSVLAAESAWVLPPIVAEGTPSESLAEDPLMPESRGDTLPSSSGSVVRPLADQLPFPVDNRATPGQVSQFRGLGRSVDDNDVRMLGISLSPPQGGGVDFSVFPQFLWSSYRFQLGPSLASLDPQAVAGTLTLVPWTQAALVDPAQNREFSVFLSSKELREVSAAVDYQNDVAIVAGHSDGDLLGPSGMVSGRWRAGSKVQGKYHLLLTDVEAKVWGSETFPTPNDVQRTIRAIPIVQADWEPRGGMLVKSSAFYDMAYTRYDGFSSGIFSRDQVRQGGGDVAVLVPGWKIGVGARNADFQGIGFEPPSETTLRASVTRELELKGDWNIEPTVSGVSLNGVGAYPEAGVSARREANRASSSAIFGRVAYSRRFPTLLDRYYVIPGYQGNPNLAAEKDLTFSAGAETRWKGVFLSAQGYLQSRGDAIVPTATSVANQGSARVASLLLSARARAFGRLELSDSVTVSSSRLEASQSAFPLLPRTVNVSGAEWVHGDAWRAGAYYRAVSDAVGFGSPLPGYGYLDLGFSTQVYQETDPSGRFAVRLGAGLENAFDSAVETYPGYPLRRSGNFTFTALF